VMRMAMTPSLKASRRVLGMGVLAGALARLRVVG
jgi:hypothetical protein